MEQCRTHRLGAFLGSRHLNLANSGYRQPHSIISSARERSEGGAVKAERLSGLEVDNQFEFGRALHRQVGWHLALEDAVDVALSLPVRIDRVRSVRHEAAISSEGAVRVDC